MKELLIQYAEYNIWANKLIIDCMLNQPASSIDMKMTSSFNTLRETSLHCWGAEDIWLQRLLQTENPIWVPEIFKGSFKDACYKWQEVSHAILVYINKCDEAALQSIATYKDRKQAEWSTPVNEVLLHVFNHTTYHRGQLVTMLRQTGESKIPGTDFIAFVRLRK